MNHGRNSSTPRAIDNAFWCRKTLGMNTRPPHAVDAPAFPAVPLGFVRSALFGVARYDAVAVVHQRPLAISPLRGGKLTYSGPLLNQHHALLWQAIVQAAAEAGPIDEQPFIASCDALLRAMGGKGNDTKQRARVWSWLQDLVAARLEYSTDAQDYTGPLVFEAARDKASGRLSLRLNPKLIRLLGDEVLRNDLARKAALGRNLLALWLHDYFASHLRPPPETVETLRNWCGSPLALPQFRQRLRSALNQLAKGSCPLVVAWSIDRRDRLIVEKTATRVVILPALSAQARQAGARQQDKQRADVERAQCQRANVAL